MKTTILTAAMLLLVGTGLVSAQDSISGACATTPPREEEFMGMSTEIGPGQYLFVPDAAEEMDKLGIWEEDNKRDGLQTAKCFREGGVISVYRADAFRGFPVP